MKMLLLSAVLILLGAVTEATYTKMTQPAQHSPNPPMTATSVLDGQLMWPGSWHSAYVCTTHNEHEYTMEGGTTIHLDFSGSTHPWTINGCGVIYATVPNYYNRYTQDDENIYYFIKFVPDTWNRHPKK